MVIQLECPKPYKKILILFFLLFHVLLFAQAGSEKEPVRYIGKNNTSNSDYESGFHDGQMRVAIGVQNYQILRANRIHPEWADGLGWTYNHAPMLAYRNNQFYCQYITNPVGEHIPPGVTMLTSSRDGRDWTKTQVLFPIYSLSDKDAKISYTYMHQRMGFYIAPNGCFLTMAFYGSNDGYGIGRVVREIYPNDTLGSIYFIRINDNWSGEVKYPFYTNSPDSNFIDACNDFLSDKVRRVQWWEEDNLAKDSKEFYRVPRIPENGKTDPGKAFCFYTRPDGAIIGFFKDRWVTMTYNKGENWSQPVQCYTLTYRGAKIWAQKLDNQQYVLVYNPTNSLARHPLCIATSDDGILFDNLLNIHTEVPPKRYWGREKRPGPQYVRGIIEGNGNPPGDDLWVTYSVNKEDIWISRIPVPVKWEVITPIDDNFNNMKRGVVVKNWNIYSPQWCPIEITHFQDTDEKCLMLKDYDPYDYAKAVRVLPKSDCQIISFQLYIENIPYTFDIEIVSGNGARHVQTRIDKQGSMWAIDGDNQPEIIFDIPYKQWINLKFTINLNKTFYTITLNEQTITKKLMFAEKGTPERIVFRTGPYRLQDDVQEYKSGSEFIPGWDEAGAGEPVDTTICYIKNFKTR